MPQPKMREKKWHNGDHQWIETGHKTFDRKTDCIDTGNVWASTQLSNYVRPVSEVECNGRQFPPGHLRDFDLNRFRRSGGLPTAVENWFKKNPEGTHILYRFFHRIGERKIVHGYVITDGDYHLKFRHITSSKHKSFMVIAECITYITPLADQK